MKNLFGLTLLLALSVSAIPIDNCKFVNFIILNLYTYSVTDLMVL